VRKPINGAAIKYGMRGQLLKAGEFAVGVVFLLIGLMVWWEAFRIVLYYWSDAGRLALTMSEAARKSYEEVMGQMYWRFALVACGVAFCIYALASGPKESPRLCVKCGRTISSLPKDIKMCPYCGNQLQ